MIVERSADGCKVSRAWEGATVICIASGPSLNQEQVESARLAQARGAHVIAINDNYLIAPWADVLYFADNRWWQWHNAGVEKRWAWVSFSKEQVRKAFLAFDGQKVSIENAGQRLPDNVDVFVLKNFGPEGLSENPAGLRTGSNSGYQAMNLAVLAGAKRIVLLGYDMRFHNGKSHSHNGHQYPMLEQSYTQYGLKFNTALGQLRQQGVAVLNATPGSALAAFPHASLEQALGWS